MRPSAAVRAALGQSEAPMSAEQVADAVGCSPIDASRTLADLRRAGMVRALFVLVREPRPPARKPDRAHVANGTTAQIRALLAATPGLTSDEITAAVGARSYRLLRRLLDLGYASRDEAGRYRLTDKPKPGKVHLTPEALRAANREAKARWRARQRGEAAPLQAVGRKPAPKTPRPPASPRVVMTPEQRAAKRREGQLAYEAKRTEQRKAARMDNRRAFERKAPQGAQVDLAVKPTLPMTSDEWIAANRDRYEVLPGLGARPLGQTKPRERSDEWNNGLGRRA